MGRNFPADPTAYIDLGDITSARFPQGSTWSFLTFARFEELVADDRSVISKSGDIGGTDRNQINVRIDKDDDQSEIFRNGTTRIHDGSFTYLVDTWYLIVVTNDGTGGAGGGAIWSYTLDGTIREDATFTMNADETTLTDPIQIGVVDSGFDEMDGDIAHSCYVETQITKAESRSFMLNPYQQVLAWRAEGLTVEWYLPLIGESPEPDLSGSGNRGTINGSPSVGANPPTALFPLAIPETFPAAATSAGLDTERKRRAAVAVSHYAMSPSIVADGTLGAEDRAVAGYGYYYDFTSPTVDVFFENRHPIEHGMKPLTAAGMGGVLVE